jgi:hypothetical protein
MYKIYAQIGFGTNRQTFNKNIASAEKSPIFQSHKSYTNSLWAMSSFCAGKIKSGAETT